MMRKRSISKRTPLIEPTIRIGKRGITESQIKEIIKQLEDRKTVKVRVLRSALAGEKIEDIAQKISSETNSRIIQVIGHTITLYKPRKNVRKGERKPN